MNQRIKLTHRVDGRPVWFMVLHIIAWTPWSLDYVLADGEKRGCDVSVIGGDRWGVLESDEEVGLEIDGAVGGDYAYLHVENPGMENERVVTRVIKQQ